MGATAFVYQRLEPRPGELDYQAGFVSAVHDPVWFLTRQWLMGEFQGENATSPVWVKYILKSSGIVASDDRFDPTLVPAEAIVESEVNDWWTMGRRVRVGRRLADAVSAAGISAAAVAFTDPPPPYERFAGDRDGLRCWLALIAAGHDPSALVPEVPSDSIPAWDAEHLVYQQSNDTAFATDTQLLTVDRHRGGRLDWFSVDAVESEPHSPETAEPRQAIPTALHYPGMPNARWWEFENAPVDMGAYVPDSAHTATAILTELVHSHSDDWFVFPVLARAGHKVAIESVVVKDSFDVEYRSLDVNPDETPLWAGLQPPEDWSLFEVAGLRPNELLLWNVAETPLESLPIERVQFGVDEEANLLWAVERVVDGREVGHEEPLPPPVGGEPFNSGTPSGDTSKEREYAYVPARGIARYWYPYLIPEESVDRIFVQYRLPDLTWQHPVPMPRPRASVLQPPEGELEHRLAPRAVAVNGIEVERRWNLARDIQGSPVLWIERQRRSLLAPPARRLRFDVMEEALASAPDG